MPKSTDIDMGPMQKQMLDDVFEAFTMLAGGNMVTLMHVKGGVTRYTPAAVELFDLPGEYIQHGVDKWSTLVHPEDRRHYLEVMTPLTKGETFSYDLYYRVRTRSGEYGNFRFIGASLRDDSGQPALIGGVIINEGYTATTDSVTILQNQYAFYSDVSKLLDDGKKLTVLLVGISGLTRINELYGYGFGNRVLQELAWMLQENVRGADVYRMEGVSFAIVSKEHSAVQMSQIYNSLRQKLRYGIRVEGRNITPIAAAGLVSAEGKLRDARSVYTCADFAFRVSKNSKHGELVPYEAMNDSVEAVTLGDIDEIRASVVDGCRDFILCYQPIMKAGTGKVSGVETFVRWHKDPAGKVFPERFLSVLEGDYVFDELGNWVLNRAMQDGLNVIEKYPDILVGINIFSIQLEDKYFGDELQRAMKRTGFPAANLCLELTKGCRLLDIDYIKSVLGPFQEKGVHIAIDDYGEGFESLRSLKELKPRYVKYDIGQMKDFRSGNADQKSLRAITELVNAYGSDMCVKGVNDRELFDILSGLPISSVQGDHSGKPVPMDELLTIL